MTGFAERTGLASDRPGERYLWTDAFAVTNFLELARLTGEKGYADLALLLVDRVHRALGRYRSEDTRTGWISGLGEREGESHPTRGGLRIGKKLPERDPAEPFDEDLEWDRDGQYFPLARLHWPEDPGRPEEVAAAPPGLDLLRSAQPRACHRLYWIRWRQEPPKTSSRRTP
jgi:hypothetical protein